MFDRSYTVNPSLPLRVGRPVREPTESPTRPERSSVGAHPLAAVSRLDNDPKSLLDPVRTEDSKYSIIGVQRPRVVKDQQEPPLRTRLTKNTRINVSPDPDPHLPAERNRLTENTRFNVSHDPDPLRPAERRDRTTSISASTVRPPRYGEWKGVRPPGVTIDTAIPQ